MSLDVLDRVTINSEVRAGQPIIRGTRTAVVDILSLLAAGAPRTQILEDFPWLTGADVDAALTYFDSGSGFCLDCLQDGPPAKNYAV